MEDRDKPTLRSHDPIYDTPQPPHLAYCREDCHKDFCACHRAIESYWARIRKAEQANEVGDYLDLHGVVREKTKTFHVELCHAANGLKYYITMVPTGVTYRYRQQGTTEWKRAPKEKFVRLCTTTKVPKATR